MATRPANLRHWSELERAEESRHPATGEARAFAADLSGATEMTRLSVRHERLMPGRRSSPPHAERDEEELVVVLEGTPDLWQDGYLHRLKPGVVAMWPDLTGIAHCLINNSDAPVRYVTIGEASRYRSRVAFPHDLKVAEWFAQQGKLWSDAPKRRQGPHGGLPDAVQGAPPKGARKAKLPPNAVDWRTLEIDEDTGYPGYEEKLSGFASLNALSGLGRIGGGIDVLQPGRRTSFPHAEGDEEEFTFVVEGTPTLWQEGRLYPLKAGDFVGWPSGTGIAHTLINNSDAPAILLTFGEASRKRARVWYPMHPKLQKTLGERMWTPPKRQLGPHDGVPDLQRPKRKAKR